jgi:tetratricopeptide (TPR) repeat protein
VFNSLKAFLTLTAIILFAGAVRLYPLYAESSAPKPPPLVRLALPFTANKLAILAKLRRQDFAGLDAEFARYQDAFEKNPAAELNEKLAFDSFATDDPTVGELIARWIKEKPDSFAAHMALGNYFAWKGWRTRGEPIPGETGSPRPEKRQTYFDRSARDLRSALGIRPKLSLAYAVLLGEARAEEDQPRQQKIGAAAIGEIPASFVVREEAMECLYPRWGGDHKMMADFAQQSQLHGKENPCLHWLLGFVARDQGETLAIDGDLDRSIEALTLAIRQGGDYSGFYFSRGESYLHRERYQEALRDFDRADELSPQDPELIVRRAAALARLGRPKDALADLKFVAIFEAPDQFSTQLHDWALNEIKQQSPTR